jgi:hypothetical protein
LLFDSPINVHKEHKLIEDMSGEKDEEIITGMILTKLVLFIIDYVD